MEMELVNTVIGARILDCGSVFGIGRNQLKLITDSRKQKDV
jgi:hypothetical protein